MREITHKLLVFSLLIMLFSLSVNGQTTAAVSVDTVVNTASERSKTYLEAFKNLLSEEKKSFEIYDKKGEVKKRRMIESTFLVYQLSKDQGQIAEFRNVTAVDGKKLESTDERAKDFFEKVVASESSQKELVRIRDESTRYDEDFAINGLTLFQAIAFDNGLKPSFKFTAAGKESIDGVATIVLSFEQTSPNPSISVNGNGANNYDIEIDENKGELNARIRGKIWIDPSTYNVRREVRERTIQPAGYEKPVVVAEDTFEYTDSEFGILTPKKMVHLQYLVKLKDRELRKDTRVQFDYGKFTKPDVEVKSSEVKSKT